MYKNQLQELAQRSCFNLPWYTCLREGPDHAPRFKAVVNFNGESFESPNYCSTLRQAEHTAAEAALSSLSSRHSQAARILDESGVYKNLLQEIAQRVGSPLPQYVTYKSGSGHLPVFNGTVELAGITFAGEPAKNKKQAEKNAALASWLSLKQLAQQEATSSSEQEINNDEQEQIRIARALQNYRSKVKMESTNQNFPIPFQQKFSSPTPRPASPQRPAKSGSKILPLFLHKTSAQPNRPSRPTNDTQGTLSHQVPSSRPPSPSIRPSHVQRFPAPYFPVRQCRPLSNGMAPPVTLRTSVPVFSAPPHPPPTARPTQPMRFQPAQPVTLRTAVPVFSAPPTAQHAQAMRAQPVRIRQAAPVFATPVIPKEDQPSKNLTREAEETVNNEACDLGESIAVQCLEQLEI